MAVKLPDYQNIPGWKFGPQPTVAEVISHFFPYLFKIAGLAMFVYLLWGGLHLLISGGNPEGVAEGWRKITFALIGFLLIFASWWILQIVEIVLGIPIL